MDALREQYEGGFKMSAYKDKTQGTWYVSFRYIDWTGKKTQKLKRALIVSGSSIGRAVFWLRSPPSMALDAGGGEEAKEKVQRP